MLIQAGGSIWEISTADLILRMVVAVVLGGLIGIEREWSNHAAGFRTHILVCLGSATIMLMSIYGFSQFVNETNVRIDPARLAAQVISGIGFLGAGAILHNGNMIKGLTTAASVWTVAAIGLCVGAGFFPAAILCTFLVLVSLYVLNKGEHYLLRHRRSHDVEVMILDCPGALSKITSVFGEQHIQIVNLRMEAIHHSPSAGQIEESPQMMLFFNVKLQNHEKLLTAIELISALDDVLKVETNTLYGSKGDLW